MHRSTPFERETDTTYDEASDMFVQVFLRMSSDLLHPMSLIIPLPGLLGEAPPEAPKLEVSNGHDRNLDEVDGSEHSQAPTGA